MTSARIIKPQVTDWEVRRSLEAKLKNVFFKVTVGSGKDWIYFYSFQNFSAVDWDWNKVLIISLSSKRIIENCLYVRLLLGTDHNVQEFNGFGRTWLTCRSFKIKILFCGLWTSTLLGWQRDPYIPYSTKKAKEARKQTINKVKRKFLYHCNNFTHICNAM